VIDNDPTEQGPVVIGRSTRTAYKDYDIQLDISGKTGTNSAFAFSST
jgi:hypothetical protein